MAEPFVQYFFRSDFDPGDPAIKFIVCSFLSPSSESEFYKFRICFEIKVFSGKWTILYYKDICDNLSRFILAVTYCFNNKN